MHRRPSPRLALALVVLALALVACKGADEGGGPRTTSVPEPESAAATTSSTAAEAGAPATGAPPAAAPTERDEAPEAPGVVDEATLSGLLEPLLETPAGVEPSFGQKVERWGGAKRWREAAEARGLALELRLDALEQVEEVILTLPDGAASLETLTTTFGEPIAGAAAGERVWLAPAMGARAVWIPAAGDAAARLHVQPLGSAETLIGKARFDTDGGLLGQTLDKLVVAFDVVTTPTDPPEHLIRLPALPRSPHHQPPEAVLTLDDPRARDARVVAYQVRVWTGGDAALAAELDAALVARFGELPPPDAQGWRALVTAADAPAVVFARTEGDPWSLVVRERRELAATVPPRVGALGPAAGLRPGQRVADASLAAPLFFGRDGAPLPHAAPELPGTSFSVTVLGDEIESVVATGPAAALREALERRWKKPSRTAGTEAAPELWWHDARTGRRARLSIEGEQATLAVSAYTPALELVASGPRLGPSLALLGADRAALVGSSRLRGPTDGDTVSLELPPTEVSSVPLRVIASVVEDRVAVVEVELPEEAASVDALVGALRGRFGRGKKADTEDGSTVWRFERAELVAVPGQPVRVTMRAR